MKINRKDIGYILEAFPEAIRFNPDMKSDFLICTLGFEDRTHKILDELIKTPSHHKYLVLITYPTNEKDNEVNRDYFEKARPYLKDIIELKYNSSSFLLNFHDLIKENINTDDRIIFDISTCSSYLFYPIMKSLLAIDINLTITYTEAETYYPTEEEWNEVSMKAQAENKLFVSAYETADFQSSGIDTIYSSTLFHERNPGMKTSILVAIPNFNPIRMQSIKEKDFNDNKTDSKNINWLVGIPPGEKNKWRVEALIKTNGLSELKSANISQVSTFYYKDILKHLEVIWDKDKYTTHLSIGSLGSKLQHLGTFFFMWLHPDVGLWLAEPTEFKSKEYSKGFGEIHQINFESTKVLRNKLSEYMQYTWEL